MTTLLLTTKMVTRDTSYIWDNERTGELVDLLLETSRRGERTDAGGFYSRVYTRIDDAFEERGWPRPGGTKIKDKREAMRRDWKEVKSLLEHTGFGIEPVSGHITASESTWDALLHSRPELKKWRRRALPYQDKLAMLFEGTTATGMHAQEATRSQVSYASLLGSLRLQSADDEGDSNSIGLLEEFEDEGLESSQFATPLPPSQVRSQVQSSRSQSSPSLSVTQYGKRRRDDDCSRPSKRRIPNDSQWDRFCNITEARNTSTRRPQAIQVLEKDIIDWPPARQARALKFVRDEANVDLILTLSDGLRLVWLENMVVED